MTRTPYELRLDLLRLSKDILMEQYQNNRMAKENDYYAQREIQDRKGLPVPPFPDIPFTVTQEAVIKMSTELNKFITNG
jgi:hypothetical protein